MRVSYNGYYVSFPRKRREFDSLHPHHFLLSILFALLIVFPVNALPAPNVDLVSPRVIIYNLNEDKILYEKDADTETPVASLTKLMTATIILEDNFIPTQQITVTADMLKGLEEFAIVGLKPGQQISVDELMYALMLPSAGDAAQALAINNSGSLDQFVAKMNTKAQELGLIHTHFNNTVGFDDNNYSSARDIATLTKYALNVPNFRTYFEADQQFLPSLNQTVTKTVRSTAQRYGLDANAILGAKTGYTDAAGVSLVSTSTPLKNVNYLAVTLNAPAGTAYNVTDTLALYHYYDDNYSYRTVKQADEGVLDIAVKDSAQKTYTITAPEEIKIFLPNDLDLSQLEYKYDGIQEIPRGTKEGDNLGTVMISWNGETLYTFTATLRQKIDFYPYELWIILGVSAFLFVIFVIMKLKTQKKRRH